MGQGGTTGVVPSRGVNRDKGDKGDKGGCPYLSVRDSVVNAKMGQGDRLLYTMNGIL